MRTFDSSLEADTRRIAIEMGNPAVADGEWDIFFGRRTGAISEQQMAKMVYAYSAARSLAGSGRAAPGPALRTMAGLAGIIARHPFRSALAVLALYLPLALYLAAMPRPSDSAIMQPPFLQLATHAWLSGHIVPYAKADSEVAPRMSTALLYEDGRLLGPAHSSHRDIGSIGLGRYSFREDGTSQYLIFSTSDNSDPNTNGRTYRLVDPEAVDPYLAPRPDAVAAK